MAIPRYFTAYLEENWGQEGNVQTIAVNALSVDVDVNDDSMIIAEGGLARSPMYYAVGAYLPEMSLECYADLVNLGWLLWMALGNLEGEGTSQSPYLITPADAYTLPSFTARIGSELYERKLLGCVCSKMELACEIGLAKLSADFLCKKDTKGTLLESVSYPSKPIISFTGITVERPTGTNISAKIKSLNLSIENDLNTEDFVTFASRFAQAHRLGSLKVGLKLTAIFDSLNLLESFWGGTSGPSESGTETTSLALKIFSGASENLVLNFPAVLLKKVTHGLEGRDPIELEIEGEALADADTGSPAISAQLVIDYEFTPEQS